MISLFYKQDHFPLIQLAEPERRYDLPGKDVKMTANDLAGKQHMIIFGEAGHLTSEFIVWHLSALEDKSSLAYLLASADEEVLVPRRLSKILQGANFLPDFIDKSETFSQSINKKEFFDAISQLEKEQVNQLIIRHAQGNDKFTIALAETLRRFSEFSPTAPSLQVLNFASSYYPFSDKPECSRYAACQYKLANLSGEHIASLFAEDHMPQKKKIIQHVLEHTGGQPTLVTHLLQRLKELKNGKNEFDKDSIDEAMRRIRVSPPLECAAWIEHLKSALKSNPALAHRFEAYVRGESIGPTYFPPLPDERELFVSGWVGLDQDGRWGITSQFHAHLARQVLLALKR